MANRKFRLGMKRLGATKQTSLHVCARNGRRVVGTTGRHTFSVCVRAWVGVEYVKYRTTTNLSKRTIINKQEQIQDSLFYHSVV